ncbi:MAG: RNA polymerase sigma factor [Peptococcaceae bacterium]|nr:RNA polymerase sigma factor [Peptococcaceae bacterium]
MPKEASFEQVYEQLFAPVYRFVKLRIPESEVDDVTSEIIVKVWRSLPGFAGKSSLTTWALRIAYHQVADYYRALQAKPKLQLQAEIGEDTAEGDPSEQVATSLSVSHTLAQMSEAQVAVIQLRLVQSLSAAETGEILGMSGRAVDSLLYRAKKSFRKLYCVEAAGGNAT